MSKEKRHGDNGPAPKHRPTPPPNPLTVESTSRQVIERKLLAALDDKGKVAILATQADLDDIVFVFDLALSNVPIEPERGKRLAEYVEDIRRLRQEAFWK
jgi:hypothetical protein